MSKYKDDEFYNLGLEEMPVEDPSIDITDKVQLAEEALKLKNAAIVKEAVTAIDEETFLKAIVEKLLKVFLPSKYEILSIALKKIHDQNFLKKLIKYFGYNWPELKDVIENLTDVDLIKDIVVKTKDTDVYIECISKLKSDSEFLLKILLRDVVTKIPTDYKPIIMVSTPDFVKDFILKNISNTTLHNLKIIEYSIEHLGRQQEIEKDFAVALLKNITSVTEYYNMTDTLIRELLTFISQDEAILKELQSSESELVRINSLLALSKLNPNDQELHKKIFSNTSIDSEERHISLDSIEDVLYLENYLFKKFRDDSDDPGTGFSRKIIDRIIFLKAGELERDFYKKVLKLKMFPYAVDLIVNHVEDEDFNLVVKTILKLNKEWIQQQVMPVIENQDILKMLFVNVTDIDLKKLILTKITDSEWISKVTNRSWGKGMTKEKIKVEEEQNKFLHHKKQLLHLLLPLAKAGNV